MKGKIISILFLIGFLLAPATKHLLYKLGRNRRFHDFTEQKGLFRADQIVTIEITDPLSIHWEKKGKEFFLNGKLYDVLNIENTGNSYLIKCVPDIREDNLVSMYTKSVDPSSRNTKAFPKLPKIKNKICLNDSSLTGNPEIIYTNIEIILTGPAPSSPILEIYLPPPEHFYFHFVG